MQQRGVSVGERQLPLFRGSPTTAAPVKAAGPYSEDQRARLEREAHGLCRKGARTDGWRQSYAYILASADESHDEFDKRMKARERAARAGKPLSDPTRAGWIAYGWQRGGIGVRVVVPQTLEGFTAEVLEQACVAIALVSGDAPDAIRARVLVGT